MRLATIQVLFQQDGAVHGVFRTHTLPEACSSFGWLRFGQPGFVLETIGILEISTSLEPPAIFHEITMMIRPEGKYQYPVHDHSPN